MEKEQPPTTPYRETQEISFDSIVTQSPQMRKIFDLAKNVSQSDINVLINGETGTGKEILARAIHNNSSRKNGPFVVINCAGIPDTLLESELFGHEKGAFTDAARKKLGKFELAQNGTLFLDEVGDLSQNSQPKILRAIEDKRFDRLGGEAPIDTNCRIISATNKDLTEEIKKGLFREDLYYRLCETRFLLPPLRERPEDIPVLVNHFIEEFNKKFNKKVEGASDVVQAYLQRYAWPGNIRELKSIIKIGMTLIEHDRLWMEDLPFNVEIVSDEKPLSGNMSLEENEKNHILTVLKHAQWNKVKAANLLQISRPTLDRKIDKYNLK